MAFWGTWLAQLVEYETVDRVMSSSPILGVESTLGKKKVNGIKKTTVNSFFKKTYLY